LNLLKCHRLTRLIISEYHPSNYQTGFVDGDESVSDVIGALKNYMKDEEGSDESSESEKEDDMRNSSYDRYLKMDAC